MPFGMKKTKMAWLPDDEIFRRYVNSFWQNVLTWRTHRQTDRQTPHDSIGRACKASRGKNTVIYLIGLKRALHLHLWFGHDATMIRLGQDFFQGINVLLPPIYLSVPCRKLRHSQVTVVTTAWVYNWSCRTVNAFLALTGYRSPKSLWVAGRNQQTIDKLPPQITVKAGWSIPG